MPVGRRRFASLGPLQLERGAELPEVTLAYETWGELAPDGRNAVLLEHALTGDSHAAGVEQPGHPTPGWWDGLIGPGRVVNTERWFVVCPNVLGGCQGSTGPASLHPDDGRPWASRFPALTIRDQVAAELGLADVLGIDSWAAVIGGSMGGMRVLEWAVTAPERVRGIAPLAVSASATADQIGLQSIQLHAIRADRHFRGGEYLTALHDDPGAPGPTTGLALARRLAHWSYRSREEFHHRFGRAAQQGEEPFTGGRFAIESYLDHQAGKLVRRFDAASYVVLTEAMNTHDVGRGRGGIAAALARYRGPAAVAGVDSDRLYPLEEQHALAHLLGVPGQRASVIRSPHGHDAFLLEDRQVGALLADLLRRVGLGAPSV